VCRESAGSVQGVCTKCLEAASAPDRHISPYLPIELYLPISLEAASAPDRLAEVVVRAAALSRVAAREHLELDVLKVIDDCA